MWPGFKSFVERDAKPKDRSTYLNMIYVSNNLEPQNEDDVILQQIHSWMDSPTTRCDGLRLWYISLIKSSIYVNNWGKILDGNIKCPSSLVAKKLSLNILSQIVLKFGTEKKYDGAFQRFLPAVLKGVLEDSEKNEGFVFSCQSLAVCMKKCPIILGSMSEEIQKFLLNNLDTDSAKVIEALADCFAVLPQCLQYRKMPKPPFVDVWLDVFSKAVNTIHFLLNNVLSLQSSDAYSSDNNCTIFEIVPCEEENTAYRFNRIRTLITLSQCLAKLISSDACRVRCDIESLLELVKRMLTFQIPEEITRQDAEDLHLLFIFYSNICLAAFSLLEALVLNFTVNEQINNIGKLVMIAIDSSLSPRARYSYSLVRWSAWRFLNTWIGQSGCTVIGEIPTDQLITELLKDIEFKDQEEGDSPANFSGRLTCAEALIALNSIILNGKGFFGRKTMENVSTTVLRIIRKVQLHLNPSNTFPSPYSDEKCRLELYDLMLTCSINGDPDLMKITLRTVNLFKMALKDPSIQVTKLCHRAFMHCRYFLHPMKPVPEYLLHSKQEVVNVPPKRDSIVHWEDNPYESEWSHEPLHGREAATDNVPIPPVYQVDAIFPEVGVDNENTHNREEKQDSPPQYTELETSQCYNKYGTSSKQSSPSDGGDDSESEEAMEEDKDSSVEDEDESKMQNEPAYIPVTSRGNNPHIQILEAHSTVTNQQAQEAKTDEDSSDVNVAVEGAMPPEQASMEEEEEEEEVTPVPSPKRISENGGMEDSDEEEDGFEEEEDVEEEEEDAAGEYINEDRFSPEPEERLTKKQKVVFEEASSDEEPNRLSIEHEEMESNEGCEDRMVVNEEVNGEEDENASQLQTDNPTIEAMVSDSALAEPDDDHKIIQDNNKDENASPLQPDIPSLDEMVSDFVLAEAVES